MTRDIGRVGAFVLTLALPHIAACAGAPPVAAWTPELSPSVLEAGSSAEAEVLARAAELPVGQPVDVAGVQVVASAPYAAASGRHCRELRVNAQPRLACSTEEGWVFVPVLLEGR